MMQQSVLRRLFRRFLPLLLAAAFSVLPLGAPAAQTPQVYTANRALPVHEQADAASPVLMELAPGEAVDVLQRAGGFAQVQVHSPTGEPRTGWAAQEGLTPLQEAGGAHLARVVGEPPAVRADLRSAPRANAKSLGRYYQGVLASVTAQPDNGWVKLRIGSLEGYMRTQDVVLDPPAGVTFLPLPVVTIHNPDHPGLTMRAAQSFQSDKAGNYANGSTVTVLGVTDEFAHVQAPDGKVGFMMVWALSPQPLTTDEQATAPVPAPQGPVLTIDNQGGQGSQLRTRATTSSDSLGLFRNGVQVVLVEHGEYWSKVWVDGKTGYMMTKFLLDPALLPQTGP